MTRREATNPDRWQLTPPQNAAVDLLAVGTTVTDTAKSIGVSRQSVSGWLNRDIGFRAALNERRQELWATVTDRIRVLVPKAIGVLEREIDEGSAPLAAAVHVLRAAGLYGTPPAIGPTDPDELETIEREREADQLRRHLTAF